MQFVIADLTRKLGLPADSSEDAILAAIRAPTPDERRLFGELEQGTAETRPEPTRPLTDLRVLGY
jgi:hypothetical protein